MPRVSRRNLMIGGAAAVALPAGFLVSQVATARSDVVIGYLRHKLPGLAVADADLTTFAQTYVAAINPRNDRRLYHESMFLILGNPALETVMPGRLRTAYDWVSRNLLTTFLLSTDFFGAGGQQPGRTSYVAFADPYAVGCRNPIARFDA